MKKLLFVLLLCASVCMGQVGQTGPYDPGALRKDGSAIANVLKFSLTPGTVAYEAGKLFYDINEGVLAFMPVVNGPILQIGQENWIWAYNNTGAQINNGQAVYIDSAIVGTIPEAKLARADAVNTSDVIAVATHNIANGAIGFFTTVGKCSAIDTTAWSAGDSLYLSATTAGALENAVPATGYIVRVGKVLTDNAAGAIYVNPEVCGSLCQARYTDGTAAAPSITFGSDPDTGIYRYGTNEIGFSTGGNAIGRFRGSRLEINAIELPNKDIAPDKVGVYQGLNVLQLVQGTAGFTINNSSNTTILLNIKNTTGNVLIGTTTDDGVNKLQVDGSISQPVSSGVVSGSFRYANGSIAANGTATIMLAGNAMAGNLHVYSGSTPDIGSIRITGTTLALETGSSANFSVTKDNAGTINVYIESGNLVVQNKEAAARSFHSLYTGIRNQ